jgi:hypothetical protein
VQPQGCLNGMFASAQFLCPASSPPNIS